MNFSCTFTGDGILAFLGSALGLAGGLIGVYYAARRSSRDVERQLEAEKRARLQEEERQALAVQKAILFDLDCFYRTYLSNATKFLEEVDPENAVSFRMIGLTEPAFPVLSGNAAYLGRLDDLSVNSTLLCYCAASAFAALIGRYNSSLEAMREGEVPSTERALRITRSILAKLKNEGPTVLLLVYKSARLLCKKTGVSFSAPSVWVSGERIIVERIEKDLSSASAGNAPTN